MKLQIRNGVFETNSSSTHSLTMCSIDDYKKWDSGELLYNMDTDTFVSKEEADKINEGLDDDLKIYQGALTFEEWHDYVECEYEYFEDHYTTQNGEEVVAFGYYGYN